MTHPCPVSLLSFNVHAGFDASFCYDPHRIARALNLWPWQVALLQEVDVRTKRSRRVDLAGFWATLCGATDSFETAMEYDDGQYGLAILSRLPVLDRARIDLAIAGAMEPRLAMGVRVRTPAGPLWVFNVHLGLDADERRQQIPLLSHSLASFDGPLVLGGDFNTGDTRETAPLAAAGLSEAPNDNPSYPAPNPLDRIDRWFYASPVQVRRCEVLPIDPEASDHLPLGLEIIYSTGTTGAG